MKRRRIIVNVILAFLILPLIKMVFDYIYLKENGSRMFSGTFLEYEKLYAPYVFLGIAPAFLLLILWPYNYLILKKRRSLLVKILIFELIFIIFICLAGTVSNIWTFPFWKNLIYVARTLPLSCLFASIIHFTVDRHEKLNSEVKAD